MQDIHRSGCPINLTLEMLGDRWSLIVIRDIMFGNRRHYRELLNQSEEGIASNTLWPRTLVATAAVQNLLGGDEAMGRARKPEIYSDAAYVILNKPSTECTGNTLLCEDVLLESGVTDLSVYDCIPGSELGVDLWVDSPNPPGYKGPY